MRCMRLGANTGATCEASRSVWSLLCSTPLLEQGTACGSRLGKHGLDWPAFRRPIAWRCQRRCHGQIIQTGPRTVRWARFIAQLGLDVIVIVPRSGGVRVMLMIMISGKIICPPADFMITRQVEGCGDDGRRGPDECRSRMAPGSVGAAALVGIAGTIRPEDDAGATAHVPCIHLSLTTFPQRPRS